MPASAPTRLELPEGAFNLHRYPSRRQEPLVAWCAADLLLLEAARELQTPADAILVANDEHGTLSTVLSPAALWTDSALSATALATNLRRNRRPPVPVLWSTQVPTVQAQLVLLRVPKNLAYFAYQLATLHGCMTPGAKLICGGMDKHLPASVADVITQHFGAVTRHRGRHKARLFSAVRDKSPARPVPAPPGYFCDVLDAPLISAVNVFSADSLDIGSRFLIQQFPGLAAAERVCDLACGNGVIGLAALRADIAATLLFADESAMAIGATRENCAALLATRDGLAYHHDDGLNGHDGRFDLILCNPPFHLGHTVDDYAGRRLIRQAANHLLPGGRLCMVANRHLPYATTLRRHFARVQALASNRKFTVWLAHTGC